jgi:hypothetical protein
LIGHAPRLGNAKDGARLMENSRSSGHRAAGVNPAKKCLLTSYLNVVSSQTRKAKNHEHTSQGSRQWYFLPRSEEPVSLP